MRKFYRGHRVRERIYAMLFLSGIAGTGTLAVYLDLDSGLLAFLGMIAVLVGRHYFRRDNGTSKNN